MPRPQERSALETGGTGAPTRGPQGLHTHTHTTPIHDQERAPCDFSECRPSHVRMRGKSFTICVFQNRPAMALDSAGVGPNSTKNSSSSACVGNVFGGALPNSVRFRPTVARSRATFVMHVGAGANKYRIRCLFGSSFARSEQPQPSGIRLAPPTGAWRRRSNSASRWRRRLLRAVGTRPSVGTTRCTQARAMPPRAQVANPPIGPPLTRRSWS